MSDKQLSAIKGRKCECGDYEADHGEDTECPGYTGCRNLDCSCHSFKPVEEDGLYGETGTSIKS